MDGFFCSSHYDKLLSASYDCPFYRIIRVNLVGK
jgi:hypothetical protein